MHHVLFTTGGDWDTTSLTMDGEEVMARQLLVELRTDRDPDTGEPMLGGVENGGEMTGVIRPQDLDLPNEGIFPGRLEMTFPKHRVVIENTHPTFGFEATRVQYDGKDVTRSVVDLHVDIDAVAGTVEAYITLYKPRFWGADEVATYHLI